MPVSMESFNIAICLSASGAVPGIQDCRFRFVFLCGLHWSSYDKKSAWPQHRKGRCKLQVLADLYRNFKRSPMEMDGNGIKSGFVTSKSLRPLADLFSISASLRGGDSMPAPRNLIKMLLLEEICIGDNGIKFACVLCPSKLPW
jgi:hypothetical protein